MTPRNASLLSMRLTLLLPLLLLAGCPAVSPPLQPPPVAPPKVPHLPAAARQQPRPPICSPTCSAGLTKLREELAITPTTPMLAASSANDSATRPSKP